MWNRKKNKKNKPEFPKHEGYKPFIKKEELTKAAEREWEQEVKESLNDFNSRRTEDKAG